MAPKKKLVKQEPFLTAVARKLGHAAGSLTKATHDLTDSVSTLPKDIATKVHDMANATDGEQTPTRTRRAKPIRKRVRSAVPVRRKHSRAVTAKRGKKSRVRRSSRKP
jgi:hypothetical protein